MGKKLRNILLHSPVRLTRNNFSSSNFLRLHDIEVTIS